VPLDDQIDDLYRLPLAEFTAARNALARTLSGADATLVKKLEKPTVVPWAVNQLYWHDRGAYDRLMKAGSAVRTAQIGALEGKDTDVRRATDAHRKALAESVERATQLAARHDASPAPEPLTRTLEALSTSNFSFHPGRLTDVVQPAGFEALTGVSPQAIPPRLTRVADAKAKAAAKPAPAIVDREAMKRAEAERKAKEARVAAAERTLERARTAVADARRALADAEEQVRTAESALFKAKR
jgi:hypothetical protein